MRPMRRNRHIDLAPALTGYRPVRWPEVTALSAAECGRDTYAVPMHCSNCGHHWTAHLPKGIPAGSSACPNCGCMTGRRTWTPDPPHRLGGVMHVSPIPPVMWVHPRYRQRGW